MITALFNRAQYFRIVFMMLLVFFAWSKVAAPVYKIFKTVYKEASATASSEEDDTERSAEKEIASATSYFQQSLHDGYIAHLAIGTNIIHLTAYAENYLAGHVREISSPPPDRA